MQSFRVTNNGIRLKFDSNKKYTVFEISHAESRSKKYNSKIGTINLFSPSFLKKNYFINKINLNPKNYT